MARKTLYWHSTGPLMTYDDDGFLHIADLNPEVETRWRMSRWEMVKLGFQMLIVAMAKKTKPKPASKPRPSYGY